MSEFDGAPDWDAIPPRAMNTAMSTGVEGAGGESSVSVLEGLSREILLGTQESLTRLDDVEAALVEINAYLADSPAGGSWCWRYLDSYEQHALLVELRDWVDYLTERYELRSVIRPCWHLHGVAVEELTGLYVAWRATFAEKPRAYSDEIIAFHDRWLWPMVRRIEERDWFRKCDGRTHVDHEAFATGTREDEFVDHLQRITKGSIRGLEADEVHELLDTGRATALRDPTKDPTTPVLIDETWWAILANSPDGRWVPRPAHVGRKLQAVFDAQRESGQA